jgi:hypothetical protein
LPGATASGYLILAMASLFCSVFAFVGCIPAIILGHKAKAKFRQNPLYNGEGMATAGLVIGYLFLGLMVISGSAFALIQEHFEPIVSVRLAPEIPPAAKYRVVDEVVPGNLETERAHGLLVRGGSDANAVALKGLVEAKTEPDGTQAKRPQRTALNGGSFGYRMKVLPDEAMSLNCRYWGGETGGGRIFDIAVNDQILATQELLTNAPGHFMDVEYRIPRSLTAGQSNILVEFQAHTKLRSGKVFVCQTLKP